MSRDYMDFLKEFENDKVQNVEGGTVYKADYNIIAFASNDGEFREIEGCELQRRWSQYYLGTD